MKSLICVFLSGLGVLGSPLDDSSGKAFALGAGILSSPTLSLKTPRDDRIIRDLENSDQKGIKDFKLEDYQGIWYEAATSLIPAVTFEVGCACTQVVYNLAELEKPEVKSPDKVTEGGVAETGAKDTKTLKPPTSGEVEKVGVDKVSSTEGAVSSDDEDKPKAGEKGKDSGIIGSSFKASMKSELDMGIDQRLREGLARIADKLHNTDGSKSSAPEAEILMHGVHRCQRGKVSDFGLYIKLLNDSKITNHDPLTLETADMTIAPDPIPQKKLQKYKHDAGFSAYRVIAYDDLKNFEFPNIKDSLSDEVDQTFAVVIAPPPVPLPLGASMGIWILVRDPKVAKSEKLWKHIENNSQKYGLPSKLLRSPYLSKTTQDETICKRFWKTSEIKSN